MIKHRLNSTDKYTIICLLFILVYSVYMIIVPPFIGIANNGDFERFSHKFGVFYPYNAWDEQHYQITFVHNIISGFKTGTPTETGFFSSYEIVGWLSRIVGFVFSRNDFYDIRFMGISSFAFLLSGVVLFFYILRKNKPFLRIVIATFVAIIMVDPYFVQFYNSFYSELGIFVFGIYFIDFSVLTCKKFSYPSFLFELFFMMLMCLTKPQNYIILLSCCFFLCLQALYYHFSKLSFVFIILFLLITVLIIIRSLNLNKNYGTENNLSYNVIVVRLLRLSDDPEKRLSELEFDNDNIELIQECIGYTVFAKDIILKDHSELYKRFDRSMEVKILLAEPSLIIKSLLDIQKGIFSKIPLGNFESTKKRTSSKKLFNTNIYLINALFPRNFYFYIIILFMGLGFVLRNFKKEHDLSLIMLFVLISSCLIYAAVAFGDDCEDGKHLFAASIFLEIVYVYVLSKICSIVWNQIKRWSTK